MWGTLSNLKRAPKSKFSAKYQGFFDYLCRFVFKFKLFKIMSPHEVGKHKKK